MSAKQNDSNPTSHDPDTPPEITEDWVAEADLYQGKSLVRRGRPCLEHPRQLLSLRLPPKVIERWRSTGPGWQTRMAKVWRNQLQGSVEHLRADAWLAPEYGAMTPRHPVRWASCNGIQGDTLVKSTQKLEMFLLLFGGGLLLLHGIANVVRMVEYLTTHQATTAYAAGFATGEVVATLCFLAAGVGLLWLAWTKRTRRAPLA